jgi:hypothetical protein
MTDVLSAAVRNNAEWCALVCRTHGIESRFDDDVWRCLGAPPPYYPSVVTLGPAASVRSASGSVKDSFAVLDLPGFRPLFDAQWISRPASLPVPSVTTASARVSSETGLREWAAAWGGGDVFRPALLDDPDVVILAVGGGGAILNRASGVIGVSNLFAAEPGFADQVWAACVRTAAEVFPGFDLVGYEQGEDLAPAFAAGFAVIGPLRVWVRD